MWQQTKKFNQATAGKVVGFCLQNVRLGYGIGAKYKNAITAAQHTQLHKDRNIPKGVDVPLFYSWKTDGHINVRLADGRVWNDGSIYKSLADFEARAPISPKPVFLGWGESINDVKVLQFYKEDKFVIEEQRPVYLDSYYAKMNPDLAKNGVKTAAQRLAHWKKYGIKEGRASAPNFHVKEYVANYSDLTRVYGATKNWHGATVHYFNFGINEGRNGRKKSTPVTDAYKTMVDKIKSIVGV